MLAVRRGSGALVPNISGFDGLRLRAATKAAAARKRPCHSGGCRTVGIVGADHKRKLSIKGVKNVLSLQVARERARQAKAASDRQNSKRSNQRLLERLEAENAQLRDCVVVLMLEIQALHDGAR